MSWRFRKTFKDLPDVKLKLDGRGRSATPGVSPFSVNVGPRSIRAKVVQALFVMSYLLGTSAQCAGPVLTPQQVQAAIQEGSTYKSVGKFLEKGLKGQRVKLASAMAMDGISKYATFFNDWQAVAAEAAAAHQQMRELKPDEVQSKGLLHAFVEIHARGASGTGKLDRRYGNDRAHLVLKIGDRIVQPLAKNMIYRSGQSVAMFLLGSNSSKITLDFAFDVSPEDLKTPVEIILIDGDGNKHHQTADLSGILEVG